MSSPAPGAESRLRVLLSEDRVARVRRVARGVLGEPFTSRSVSEAAFEISSGLVAVLGLVVAVVTFVAGSVLAITFVGVALIAAGLRASRGIGAWQRALARNLLGEAVPEPEPFRARPGFLGWLSGALRDRAAWRSLGYTVAKLPLVVFGTWFTVRVWFEALAAVLGVVTGLASPFRPFGPAGSLYGGHLGFVDRATLLLASAVVLVGTPWLVRLMVALDRVLVRMFLGPDPMTTRVRSLEQSRAQTVDASAATLRRIERNLHDGTQAQLVALAMRLGQAKEKLAEGDEPDLDAVRRLVSEAHRGAKEAIVELRDLARGIHPPVLDTGLEGALATLVARSPVATTLEVSMQARPTPAIEAISYFCVAELLANVAQHAQASRAQVSCVEHGPWLRIVVRDDGHGGAAVNRVGTRSSGLAGLTDRVGSVDGHLVVASPAGGPTVVTLDLPLHA